MISTIRGVGVNIRIPQPTGCDRLRPVAMPGGIASVFLNGIQRTSRAALLPLSVAIQRLPIKCGASLGARMGHLPLAESEMPESCRFPASRHPAHISRPSPAGCLMAAANSDTPKNRAIPEFALDLPVVMSF